MQRVERHIIMLHTAQVKNQAIDKLSFLSKNLYNIGNYYIRRRFIKSGRFIPAYQLIKIFTRLNQVDYRALPIQSAQQVLILLEKNWKSFFKAVKEYQRDKTKFKSRPKLPKYKNKKKGRNIIIFTKQQISIKDDYIYFPVKADLEPLKTKVKNIQQVRIVPQSTCYVIEVIYNKEVKKNENLDENLYLSIDLGLNNLGALTSNKPGLAPLLINGRPLKAINQYFNKKKAILMSYVGDKGVSNRIKKLTHKRNQKINDYLHKTSRLVINYCEENKIKNIVVGKNKNWKQEINIGRKNNQNFVNIPIAKLIDQIEYKAEERGIRVKLTEENYTSKCSFLDKEGIKKHKEYKGRRLSRGLFKTAAGMLINADINGSLNILRKAVPKVFADGIEGIGLYPIKINIF